MSVKIKALDSKVNFGMFLKAMGGRLQSLLASTLTPEEKLVQIIKELEKDVQGKRVLARQIKAQMSAIADPDTKELEPLEAFQARRVKLVKLGGTMVNDPSKTAQLGQLQQEIKALDVQISSQQNIYDTLKESYDLARSNYQQALSSLDMVKSNGPAMLKAIQAQKDALEMRDRAKSQDTVDVSFMNELTAEFSMASAELRSDKEIDNDLDATSSFNVDKALAAMDAESLDSGLMAEFQAAANK